ncbi:hypothetical protein ACV229_09235 [Burkholderia sp. MR1-5-21]
MKLILVAILWIPFTYWTVRYLKKLRNQPNGRMIYRRGVLGLGVPSWLMGVIVSLAIIPERDIYSLLYWAVIFLCVSFPLCLWAGYFWAKGMAAIFPAAHDQ